MSPGASKWFVLLLNDKSVLLAPEPCSPLLSAPHRVGNAGHPVGRLAWSQHLRRERRGEKEGPPREVKVSNVHSAGGPQAAFFTLKHWKGKSSKFCIKRDTKVVKTQLTLVSSRSTSSVHSGNLEGGCSMGVVINGCNMLERLQAGPWSH